MSGVLFIGEAERAEIAAAVVAARANTVPWSEMQAIAVARETDSLMISERGQPEKIAEVRRKYPPQRLQLGTYSVALSFEEQPGGIFRHVSIASRDPGKVPNEHVVKMVVEACGFSAWPPSRPYRVWVEEFEPGHMAINLVEQTS